MQPVLGSFLLLALVTCFPARAQAQLANFAGVWEATNKTGALVSIEVSDGPLGVRVAAWGRCQPRACPWGVVQAEGFAPRGAVDLRGQISALSARFLSGPSEKLLVLRRGGSGTLVAQVFLRYVVAGGVNLHEEVTLRRQRGAAKKPGRCRPLDPARLVSALVHGRWKVRQGSQTLDDFGADRQAAEDYRRILVGYEVTSLCTLGGPGRGLRWLETPTGLPHGSLPNERCQKFNPEQLVVASQRGRWTLKDGARVLADLGIASGPARATLTALQAQGATRLCEVGSGKSGRKFFRR